MNASFALAKVSGPAFKRFQHLTVGHVDAALIVLKHNVGRDTLSFCQRWGILHDVDCLIMIEDLVCCNPTNH